MSSNIVSLFFVVNNISKTNDYIFLDKSQNSLLTISIPLVSLFSFGSDASPYIN